jgi:hypothetical protein
MKPETTSLKGCPIIYEYPIDSPIFKGPYKIGYDPYRQDRGSSLSAIFVYKSAVFGQYTKNIIVAEYIGRPGEADDVNYIAYLFAKLYNTEVMHENEVTHVKDYFRRRKLFKWLAHQPDQVISKNVKASKVARIWGCHMVDQLKDAGEKYIKSWLEEVHDIDENGGQVRTIDRIFSPGLLEELIAYNRKGNFDRVMALMQVMFQQQEEILGKVHGEEQEGKVSKVEQLRAMKADMYKKSMSSRNLSQRLG